MESCIRQIKKTVGNNKVLVSTTCGLISLENCKIILSRHVWRLPVSKQNIIIFQALLSGGVDSTVLAALLHKVM